MKKWKLPELQNACTEAKEQGLIAKEFECGGKGVTKKVLFDKLVDARVLSPTGELMEQISMKLTVYIIIHSTNDWERSPATEEDFESWTPGLGHAYNVFGTYTDPARAVSDLGKFAERLAARRPTARSLRTNFLSTAEVTEKLKTQPSFVLGEVSDVGVVDKFSIHRTIVDNIRRESGDIKQRFLLYGADTRRLDFATATHRGVKVKELVERLKDAVRSQYKAVPLVQFHIFFNPDAEVWYVVATGIHKQETARSTSNFIYNVSAGTTTDLIFADLGVAPSLVETTKYPKQMNEDEIAADLRQITPNLIKVDV